MAVRGGALRLLDQLPNEAVAVGYGAPVWETWNKFGYNDGLQNGVAEWIWSQGGSMTILQSPETMNVASTAVTDTFGGAGCEGVVVYGVDENWDNVIEVVLLNGTSNVETANSYYGINRVAVWRAGSNKQNDGIITLTSSGTAAVQAHMPATQGTTQQAFFFVSESSTFLADFLFVNAVKTGAGAKPIIQIKGFVFSYVSNATYEVFRESLDTEIESTIQLNPKEPFVIGEKSVLYFTAESNQNNSVVRCRISGKLYVPGDEPF